jgi:hypothetical protein
MMQSERGKPKVVKGLKLGTPTFGFTLVWFFFEMDLTDLFWKDDGGAS